MAASRPHTEGGARPGAALSSLLFKLPERKTPPQFLGEWRVLCYGCAHCHLLLSPFLSKPNRIVWMQRSPSAQVFPAVASRWFSAILIEGEGNFYNTTDSPSSLRAFWAAVRKGSTLPAGVRPLTAASRGEPLPSHLSHICSRLFCNRSRHCAVVKGPGMLHHLQVTFWCGTMDRWYFTTGGKRFYQLEFHPSENKP